MKRIILVLAGAVLGVAAYAAETVSSVSFNPSRMGEYTYLKVSDKATLSGGLSATTVNIASGGTVTMTADSSARIYEVPTVTGASGSAINMPNTVFHGNTANTYASYQSESSSAPSGLLPSVAVKGGTMTFNNDSYIQTLDAVNILKQKVGTLKGGTLEITGNGGGTVSLYDSGNTAGFHLAGNDIPEPTAIHTNTNKNLTGCQLAWEKRKTSASPAQEVYLLALQSCNGSGGSSGGTEVCSWQYSGTGSTGQGGSCSGYPTQQVGASCSSSQKGNTMEANCSSPYLCGPYNDVFCSDYDILECTCTTN